MPTLNFDDPLYLCVGGRLRGELRDADMSSFIETVRIDPRSNVPSESCSYVRETLACKIESGLETRYFFLLESDADDQQAWHAKLLAETEAQAAIFWKDAPVNGAGPDTE